MIRVSIDEDMCKGCQLCVFECGHGAIKMSSKKNKRGYLCAAAAEPGACVGCLKCAVVCPECSIIIVKEE
jgi:2-oxoglutarate ferredoxin oxidoreductase subunit delta